MGTISMSRKERKRLEAFSRVKLGGMTLVEASELLRLSYRQTKRAWSRYQSEGDAGLVHRLRGRAPNRHSPEEVKQQSLAFFSVMSSGTARHAVCTWISTVFIGRTASRQARICSIIAHQKRNLGVQCENWTWN